MSENKFIRHLQGKDTAKSVLEIRNQNTPTSFANMPNGTSNANDVYSDRRGDAAGVLKGTENWKLNGSVLIETSSVYGDGRDFTDSFDIDGNVLWVNATHTFATARRFAPNTKFVLKLCGHDLNTIVGDTIGFTLLVKFGTNNVISKVFNITEQAFDFCKEFVIDFGESNASAIKVAAGSTMTVQLLCADPFASATIYNGMTVFTALQRRVDSETVSSDTLSLDEIEYDLTTHINDKNNPHEVTKAQVGLGNCDNTSDLDKPISTATQAALDGKVSTDGSSTMTGPLKMRATSSFQCAIAPFWDGVGFFKLNSDDSVTLIASIETPDGFVPWVTNTYNIGSSLKKWKNLYLAGTAYIAKINNGYDLLVPACSGTLATKEEVDLAANSGRMILDQGVWYAKMYAATVAPAAEDGTNYADFSQVDGQGNPIIVTYNRVNGAWVQDQTITPPAEYDGYVLVTSKIWDIAEQTGQQGGRVLWNHTSKEFTPYPQIISFEDINVTGDSTVVMPQNPGANQIVNKDYVDDAIAAIPTPTEVIDAEVIGALTINGSEVSGFGYRKNLVLPGIFSLDAIEINSFEIGGSFTTPADFNSVAPYIIQGIKANTTSITGGILIRISSTDMVATIAPDGAPAVSMLGPTTLNTSTEYWFKLLWDGTTQTYSLLLSADGETFATIATKTDSVRPADATYTIGIGDGYTYIAAVDMEDWYIKKNGQIVWQGMNVPGLATKANVDLSNVLNNIDFVVESQLPTAQNNYTWYRKYKSGWVEQGGYKVHSSNDSNASVTFPVAMSDTNYVVSLTKSVNNNFDNSVYAPHTRVLSTTGFTYTVNVDVANSRLFWTVFGMAAS